MSWRILTKTLYPKWNAKYLKENQHQHYMGMYVVKNINKNPVPKMKC